MIYNLKQKLLVFSVIFGITSLFAQSSDIVFSGVFGGTVVTDDGAYIMPSGSEPWAGFANEDVSFYPSYFRRGWYNYFYWFNRWCFSGCLFQI